MFNTKDIEIKIKNNFIIEDEKMFEKEELPLKKNEYDYKKKTDEEIQKEEEI